MQGAATNNHWEQVVMAIHTKNSIDRVTTAPLKGCLFIDSEGEGLIIIKGDHNKVLNSYFKNIDWSATELDGLMVTINVDGSNNEFSNNEVYNTGASATVNGQVKNPFFHIM